MGVVPRGAHRLIEGRGAGARRVWGERAKSVRATGGHASLPWGESSTPPPPSLPRFAAALLPFGSIRCTLSLRRQRQRLTSVVSVATAVALVAVATDFAGGSGGRPPPVSRRRPALPY